MYKRILIYTLLIAAVATIVFLYFKLTKTEGQYSNSLNAIPANYSLILELNNIDQDADEMNLLLQLSMNENAIGEVSFNPLKNWPSVWQELMKLSTYQPAWTELKKHSKIVFASGEQFRSDTWLMCIGLSVGTSQSFADDLMFVWKPESKFEQRDFKNRTIMHNEKLQYCILNDCLIVTSSASLMEDAIIQNQKNDLLIHDIQFTKIYDVKSSDASFHILSKMENGNWIQLDPVARNGQWNLCGYATKMDSTVHSFQLCGDGKKTNIATQLPATTTVLDVYSYTDFETGWKKQEAFFSTSNSSKYWSQAWQDLGDSCKCDLNEMMLSWRGGESGCAIIANDDSTTSEILFYEVKDSVDVLQLMMPLFIVQSVSKGQVHQLKYPQLFERNKPQTFLVESNYMTQKGQYVFVAATPKDLNFLLNTNAILSDNITYQSACMSSNQMSGRFVYQTEYYSSPLPMSVLSFLSEAQFIGVTSETFNEEKYLLNISLPYKCEKEIAKTTESVIEEIEISTPNDTEILHGPWQVVNHNTKQNETLFQNRKNELCLKGNEEKLLWSKKLKAEIVGDVVQIDALKNGKLQYAFAAGNHLFVVDRNGKDLMSFPVLLDSPASSSLAVFDYDNTKSYRMIVGTDNGSLHNLNALGKMNEGWKYTGTLPIAMVKHIKYNGEDLLVAVSRNNVVHVLKRNGELKYENKSILGNWDKNDFEMQSYEEGITIKYYHTNGKSGELQIPLPR